MAIELTKPFRPLNAEEAQRLPGQLGVYELADETGRVVYIGFAGGKSLFGLRSELEKHAALPPHGAVKFRFEVNMQYTTRHKELLMAHHARFGEVPPGNVNENLRLGRLTIARG